MPILTMTAIASLYSEYGGYPVAISIIVQPRLQISAFFPYYSWLITSGAMKFGVPQIDPILSCVISFNYLLLPKSKIKIEINC